MKLFRILSHPYTLIFCFSFMIISGESIGGFYIMYILLGLLHGVLHSLLGFYGMLALIISYHLPLKRNIFIRQILNVIGIALLFASVFFFFQNDKAHYNWGTLEQGLPMFTLMFTALIAVCCLIGTFWKPQPKNDEEQGVLSKV
ncbi:hypothetical protein [Flavisolibacter nicotianae]|uniref:hypothetical protein n=1 Tax=Flavisolibacter nicotianae TaxID=2364882 RepID=UPI000EB095CA|nr:hypothetical protein [Flavisolibacter nicotianae]